MSTFSARVTQRSIGQRALINLQSNLTRVGNLQERLSSGKQITRPSDDPTGTVSAMQLRSQTRVNEQWGRNADDGLGWLGAIDDTLTGMQDMVRRVRDLTLQGMSSGQSDQQSRDAMAAEVGVLRDGLLGMANTRYLDRPVFAGASSVAAAYDSAGAFQAAGAPEVSRTVGEGASVEVSMLGTKVFGPAGNDLFKVLADIQAHLSTDPPGPLSADLANLDAVRNQMQNALSTVGARYHRLEQMRQAADDQVLLLKNNLSEVEDIDLPKTLVELQMQQIAYQSALGATAKVVQPSLLDFLR